MFSIINFLRFEMNFAILLKILTCRYYNILLLSLLSLVVYEMENSTQTNKIMDWKLQIARCLS